MLLAASGWTLRSLAAVIHHGSPAPVLATDALRVIRVIEFALESHRDGRTVVWPSGL